MKKITNPDSDVACDTCKVFSKKLFLMKYKMHGILLYSAAFLIPCILFSVLLYLKNIYPFGDFSNCKDDLQIQYYDFFCYLKNVFNGEAGIEYTFTKTIGSSTLALIGYYLLSPLNLLIVLFKKSQIQLFVFIITTIKLGLCSAFTSFYLSKRFPYIPKYYNIVLSIAFAFTQYALGQSANINWLDGLYMLPLIMLGVYLYVKESKYTLMCISFTLSIIFCWYIAYMNCIFAVLYFFCELLLSDKFITIKQRLIKTLKFLLLELLGVMMSFAIFLPVLLSQASGRSFDEGIINFETNGKFLDILKGLLIGAPFPSRDITFYCSILVLLFFFSFLFLNINIRKKLIIGSFFIVTTLLLFFKPLEYVMCGFKFVGSYAYRHGYLLIMTAIYVAAMSLNTIYEQQVSLFKKDKSIAYAAVTFIACLLMSDWINGLDAKRLWIQISVILIYILLLYAKDDSNSSFKYRKAFVSFIIALVFCVELMFNAKFIFVRYSDSASYNIEYTMEQQETVDNIKDFDKEFYRMESTYNRGNDSGFFANESLAYGYSSIQSYTSTYESDIASLLIDSGYCTNEFPTFYTNPILPMDSFLGIKYLMSEKNYAGYIKTDINGLNDIYQNPYALPLAFKVADSANNNMRFTNSFGFINSLYSNVLGEKVDIMKEYMPISMEQDAEGITYLFENQNINSNDILYLYIDNPSIQCSVFIDGNKVTDYNNGQWGMYSNIAYLGSVTGVKSITFSGDSITTNDFKPIFCRLDILELEKACKLLKQDAPKIISIKDGYVKAHCDSDSSGLVLFTIPKQEQWEIKVNGTIIESTQSGSPFITVPVNSGENTIELTYSAKGKTMGLIISAVSVLGLGFIREIKKKGCHNYE